MLPVLRNNNRGSANYILPTVISVTLHAGLLILVAWGWESAPVEKKTTTPKFIEAKIVELKATAPKIAPPKPKPKKIDVAAKQAEKERQRKEEDRKRKAEQAKKLKAENEKKEKLRQEKIKKEQAEKERKAKEELEAQKRLEDQLSESLAEEDEMLMAEQNEATAQSYLALITSRIKQNWSRPPSARNGMKCRLLIELVPTGRVVNVTIIEGSGNSAFDRSAEQAVWKVEQFSELQKVESAVFEQYFRRLPVLFEPQDLRL
ncbi:MAG: cell envelope integrity protein TolA [Cellvibrionaceae bacterium]